MAQLPDFIGYLYIVLGISLLIQPHFWIDYTKQLQENPTRIISIGLMTLVLGLWIVLVHPAWTATLDVLVTVAGWLMLVKGIVLLCLPRQILKIYSINWMSPLILRIQALLILVLGLVFVCCV